MFATAADRRILASQLDRLISTGQVPIALWGAGRVAGMLLHEPLKPAHAEHLIGIIDDHPGRRGEKWGAGAQLDVVTADDALARGVRAIIITAEGAMQEAMWSRRQKWIDKGIRVLTCPQRFAGQSWDDCLIDHYEQSIAAERGLARAYTRDYPDKNDTCNPMILAAINRHMFDGAVVCEIGSGSGKWTSQFIERAGSYHCCDYSARLLHEVIEHRFAAHRAKLHLHHDEKARLSGVPDASIDLLLSIDVFVHFKIDLIHQFMTAFKRVLKPTGNAIIHFAAWNQAGIDRWRTCDREHHDGGVGPIHSTHMDWLKASAADLGLKVERLGDEFGWAFLAHIRRE